jgi:SAM-dependent methyltransferase
MAGLSTQVRGLIQQYVDGGRVPWSTGYGEYRIGYVNELLRDGSLLGRIREGGELPPGHGFRLDERAVEYPWLFSRSIGWGSRVLDAGSTLNYPELLEHPVLADRDVIICDLAHGWRGRRRHLWYVTGDLRRLGLVAERLDVVVCISTLEHIGLDNTAYTANSRYKERSIRDYRVAIDEFRRVLRSGGRLLITVPFGDPTNFGWMQQFDEAGVNDIVAAFGGELLDLSFFKYEPAGWTRSSAAACAGCEYFDVRSTPVVAADYAAAARAVACLDLRKP